MHGVFRAALHFSASTVLDRCFARHQAACIHKQHSHNPRIFDSLRMEAGEQLLQGIQEGQLRRVRAALAAGAAPGEFVGARLPLQEAAEEGSLEIVRALLSAGAEPNGRPLPGEEGPYDSPLVVAITNRHVDVASQLVQAGADVNLACEVRAMSGRCGE